MSRYHSNLWSRNSHISRTYLNTIEQWGSLSATNFRTRNPEWGHDIYYWVLYYLRTDWWLWYPSDSHNNLRSCCQPISDRIPVVSPHKRQSAVCFLLVPDCDISHSVWYSSRQSASCCTRLRYIAQCLKKITFLKQFHKQTFIISLRLKLGIWYCVGG
jgi:hypothetical protein